MTDEVLTSKEATQYLKISRKTLYDLIAKGKIKSNKVGRDYRFLKIDLDKFIRGEIDSK